jgi:hypothetical protein
LLALAVSERELTDVELVDLATVVEDVTIPPLAGHLN